MTEEMEKQFAALKNALRYDVAPVTDGHCSRYPTDAWGPVGYEPGDSTRYIMHLVRVDDVGELGLPGGGYLLTVVNMPGHSFLLGDYVDDHSFDVRGVRVNPHTVKACLQWLSNRRISGMVVEA